MGKVTKIWNHLKKATPLLCVFLAGLLLVSGLPISVLGETRDLATGSENVSDYITWSDGTLEVDKDGEWVEIEADSIFEFPYGSYKFTISWEADSEQSYYAGDYFTFTVPVEFADLTLDMATDDETVLEEIYIDEEGNGTATFTEEIEDLAEISEMISFEGTYWESTDDVQVNWEFIFSNDARYAYSGRNEAIANQETESEIDEEKSDTATNPEVGSEVDKEESDTAANSGAGSEIDKEESNTATNQETESEIDEEKSDTATNSTIESEVNEEESSIAAKSEGKMANLFATSFDPKNMDVGSPGALTLYKVDGDNNLLEGAEFRLIKSSKGEFGPFTGNLIEPRSPSNGKYVFDLPASNAYYRLVEVVSPYGYRILYNDVVIHVNGSWMITDLYHNGKVISNEYKPGQGGEVRIDGKLVYYVTTNNNRYAMAVYNDKLPTLDFNFTKVDALNGTSLPDAGFRLRYVDENVPDGERYYTGSSNGVATWTTNEEEATIVKAQADGQVKFEGLMKGTYYLEETKAPSGYHLPAGKWKIEITVNEVNKIASISKITTIKDDNDEVTLNFSDDYNQLGNVPKTIDFDFTKVKEGTNEGLSGAKFQLYYEKDDKKYYYSENEANGRWVENYLEATSVSSNADEIVSFKNLEKGTYYLVEAVAPIGYHRPNGHWEVKVGFNAEGDIETDVKKIAGDETTLEFYKRDDSSYVLGNIQANTMVDFTFTKIDAENLEPLVGAEFKLYYELTTDEGIKIPYFYSMDEEGNVTWVKIHGEQTSILSDGCCSDEEGNVTFKNLTDGTYILIETVAPIGYHRPNGYWEVKVENGQISITPINQIGEEDDKRALEFSIGADGIYKLKNTEADSTDFTFTKMDITSRPLKGAEFKLYYEEKIFEDDLNPIRRYYQKSADGEIRWVGSNVEATTVSSDENGFVSFVELVKGDGEPRSYYLEETKAPDGYSAPEGSWEIQVESDDTINVISHGGAPEFRGSYEEGYKLTNVELMDFTFTKVDDVTLGPLGGAEFTIYDKDGNVIATETSDSNGIVNFTNLERRTYILRETKVPDGYDTPHGYWQVEFTWDGTIDIKSHDGALEFDGSYEKGYTLKNVAISDFTFTKVNAANYIDRLSGAGFQLYYEKDGNNYYYADDGNGNVTWVEGLDNAKMISSGLTGEIRFKNLKSGAYILKETKAPIGDYQLPTGQWQFKWDAKNRKISEIQTIGESQPALIERGDEGGKITYLLGNVKSYTLPQSGGNGIYWFTVLGCFSLVAGLVRLRFMYRSK